MGGPKIDYKRVIYAGKKFGKWTVVQEPPYTCNGKVLCVCDCGTEKGVHISNLIRGKSRACSQKCGYELARKLNAGNAAWQVLGKT